MNGFKAMAKCTLLGFLWAVIGSLLAFGIESFTSYTLKDILFVEGLVLLGMAILSSVTGPSMGVEVSGLSQDNAQYMMTANLETIKKEREISYVKNDIKMCFSTLAFALGGIFCIIMNFMI
ncbi:MAG: hypothetical protein ACRCTZ_05125 [Sarcina sp.]